MGCRPWTNCKKIEEVNNNLKSPLKISITCKGKACNECECNFQFFWGHKSIQKK
jgi:hypothetical protein